MTSNMKDLLPIGSVVLLKEAQKRLMIFGVCQKDSETNKEYDYIGVFYPEGNVGENIRFLFNNEDIERVDFTGYSDEERTAFVDRLQEYYDKQAQQA